MTITVTINGDNANQEASAMAQEQAQSLQVVWEQLNAVLYDITEGNAADAVHAVEDSIKRLEDIKLQSLITELASGNAQDTISIRWTTSDVQAQYDTMFTDWDQEPECGPLNDDDFREILRLINKGHDANVGISWEVIEAHIDSFIRNRMRERLSPARPPVSPEERERA